MSESVAASIDDWPARLADLKARAEKVREDRFVAKSGLKLKDREAELPPVFVEFSGTPKSGKSSAIEKVRHFFRRTGFRVLAPAEGVSRRTPEFLRGNLPAFNVWSACYSLTNILERRYEESPYDLVLLDRALFDVSCWLEYLEHAPDKRQRITQAEKRAIRRFFLLDRWQRLLNVVVLVTVNPEQSLQREYRDSLIEEPGRAMNPDTLAALNGIYNRVADELGPSFPRFARYDTSDPSMPLRRLSYEVVQLILDEMTEINQRISA